MLRRTKLTDIFLNLRKWPFPFNKLGNLIYKRRVAQALFEINLIEAQFKRNMFLGSNSGNVQLGQRIVNNNVVYELYDSAALNRFVLRNSDVVEGWKTRELVYQDSQRFVPSEDANTAISYLIDTRWYNRQNVALRKKSHDFLGRLEVAVIDFKN